MGLRLEKKEDRGFLNNVCVVPPSSVSASGFQETQVPIFWPSAIRKSEEGRFFRGRLC